MYFLICLLLSVGACLASEHSKVITPVRGQRIVGGVETSVEKYPFMVQVQWQIAGGWRQVCGGALISTTAVLTAAHCVDEMPSIEVRVIVGTSFTSGEGGTVHTIRRNGISIYLYYSRPTNLDNDIAILHLDTPVTLGPTVQTVKFAGPNYNLPDGDVVTVIGWGFLQWWGGQPEVLQEVDVNVINQELCAERYAILKEDPYFEAWPDVTPSMFCSGILDVGEKDACSGDSGGPVMHGDVLVGLVSWGYLCADSFYPGVFARVSVFTDWIIRTSFQ